MSGKVIKTDKEKRHDILKAYVEKNTKDKVLQVGDLDIAAQVKAAHVKLFSNYKPDSIRRDVAHIRKEYGIATYRMHKGVSVSTSGQDEYAATYEAVKKIIQKQPISIMELADKFNKAPKYIQKMIDKMKVQKYNIHQEGNEVEMAKSIPQGGGHRIDLRKFENKFYKFGFVSDNHLGSKFERLDILNALYDIFEQEGITEVYNAGNWIDGEAYFNKYEIHTSGVTPQIEYFVKVYPQRKGITTYFIAGDDHEGWYVQRERINIGEYAEMKAREAGRTDLKYLGYVEADVELKSKNGSARMKIMHPGGGSAYALSYSPQKIVESFTSGEKPNLLMLGHYHKADFLPAYRGVQIIQLGTTQDQTVFMRKKKLAAHLGGWIVELQQSKDGAIQRIKTEWLNFYDKEYYKRNNYYR